jgi:hypothetical protein
MSKLSTLVGLSSLGAISLGVLAPQPSAQQKTPRTGVVATVTATGCVQRWTPSTADTTQPDDKGPSGVEYVLTDVQGETRSQTAAGGGVAERTSPATRYLLLPDPSLSLRSHLNHRVQIVGTVAPQPSKGASPRDEVIEPSSRETNLPTTQPESFTDNVVEISKLTMLARKCAK